MRRRYRLHQVLPGGELWRSIEAHEGTERDAVQAVRGGFLYGQPRAALDEDTGALIFGLDGAGKETGDGRHWGAPVREGFTPKPSRAMRLCELRTGMAFSLIDDPSAPVFVRTRHGFRPGRGGALIRGDRSLTVYHRDFLAS